MKITMKNKSIKFEHQSKNAGDLKKGPVLHIFVKRVLKSFIIPFAGKSIHFVGFKSKVFATLRKESRELKVISFSRDNSSSSISIHC